MYLTSFRRDVAQHVHVIQHHDYFLNGGVRTPSGFLSTGSTSMGKANFSEAHKVLTALERRKS